VKATNIHIRKATASDIPRLKEVIEKSRITYQKRYGTTVAASGNYFQHEIIRSLAEDDLSIMGANFRH